MPDGFSVKDTHELILNAGAPLDSARAFIKLRHIACGARTLHHQNGSFYTWLGSHYIERETEEMRAELYAFLDGAKRLDKDKLPVPFNPTKSKVANVLEASAAEAQVAVTIRPPAWLHGGDHPAAADIIACANGLLHLPTGEIQAHSPAFFTLNALDFDYQPDAPEPAEWLKFLRILWPDDQESIDTLQEWFGLTLTADTRHQKALLLIGPPRCGKGTIARVQTQLLGQANVCGPTLSSIATQFGLQPLIGKRLATISDARLGGRADQQVIVERLLSITGEDGLSIDRKQKSYWHGKLDVRFMILTNEMPRLTDSSGALANRFIVLKLTQSFLGREDLALGAKLGAEMSGILQWAIEGWKRLTARGYFVPPASSRGAQQELLDLGSPISAFLRECCIVGPGHSVRCDEIYQAWCNWCQQQGRDHPGTVQTFGRDLNAAVPGLKVANLRQQDSSRTRYYEGIGFTPQAVNRNLERDGTRSNPLQPDSYFSDDPGYSPQL